MKTLAIIPARGKSKRFPEKNIALLNGKPLIFHTIDAALGNFNKIIFTSDDDNILRIVENEYGNYSKEHKGEFIISKRPGYLASDNSKVIDTVLHYLDSDFEQIWLLLPTCPLRTRQDIRNAKQLLTKDIDSVISITDFEFPPSLGLFVGNEGLLVSSDWNNHWQKGNSRSQDHPPVFRPNGAIYGSWTKGIELYKNYYLGKVKGYYMPRNRSVDIDNEIDLKIAQSLI